jgi:hypothetical protein
MSNNVAVVRLDAEVLEELRELAAESDMSIANLASAAIRYALEHAKIKTTTKTIEVRTVVFRED